MARLDLCSAYGRCIFLLERKLAPKLYSMAGPVGRITEAFMVGLLFVTPGPIKFHEFKTMITRLLAAIMALSSTFLIAGVTAVLASAFTLDGLRSQVTGLQDLQHVRVAALQDSTSSEFRRTNAIAHQTREGLQSMMDDLERCGLDAIVSDTVFLIYSIQQGRTEGKYTTLSVLPYEFDCLPIYSGCAPRGWMKEPGIALRVVLTHVFRKTGFTRAPVNEWAL